MILNAERRNQRRAHAGGVGWRVVTKDSRVSIDKDLLDILVCPKTKAPLIQVGDWLYSTDRESRLRYPIREDIPIMLIEEAQQVDTEEFDRIVGASPKQQQ